jgi:CO/xanthine dehydrogenase Mo-binding subunit
MKNIIGTSIPRPDALEKVTGKALYPGDINMPNQAYMKILFANHVHAIVHSVDTIEAEKLSGVIAIFTAKDVPVNEYGLIMPDQPVMCGPGSSKPFADHVRFTGDRIAVVVAESEEIAAEAIKLIKVEFEDLPGVFDPLEAMKEGSVILHPERGTNIFCNYRIRKGDVKKAFEKADVIVEGEYRTPWQEHAFLQPEAGISYMDEEERVTVVVGGQWVHEDQEQVAHALHLPKEKIRIIYPAIGGAFGGREDMSVQIVLALATWRLNAKGIRRPIKIIWSREESIAVHHKRHPYYLKSKWGATKDGKVVAAETKVVADGGAYAYTSTKVLGNATLMCIGPYHIPNVSVDSYAVYTNNIVTGAFRGFGGPQGAFAAESQLNKIAEKLGMDPVEIRMRNVIHDGEEAAVQTPLPLGVSIDEVVEKCALRAGWKNTKSGWKKPKVVQDPARPYIKKGLGFACGLKNSGFSFGAPENCYATIELHGKTEIEEAILFHAGAEVGQGSHNIFRQMAAEALGISAEKVKLIVSDTATTRNSGSASASRMTFMAGNSIKGAAVEVLKRWKNEERPACATYEYLAPQTTPYDPEDGHAMPNFAYGYIAEAVESEVDIETGELNITNVIVTDDVGHAINPQQVEGQIEGAIIQAYGYAVLENFIQRQGQVITKTLSTYLIPTVLDIPAKVVSVLHEHPDPIGPWGARGMAEMPYLPFVPALVASLHEAIGVWFNEFPLTPERVLKGLGKIK